jgi:hypothetical protein
MLIELVRQIFSLCRFDADGCLCHTRLRKKPPFCLVPHEFLPVPYGSLVGYVCQPFWERHVRELGAGTRTIPRSRLTADNLAAAITEATTNCAMQEKAAELGAKITTEDGVSEAVSTIREFLEAI